MSDWKIQAVKADPESIGTHDLLLSFIECDRAWRRLSKPARAAVEAAYPDAWIVCHPLTRKALTAPRVHHPQRPHGMEADPRCPRGCPLDRAPMITIGLAISRDVLMTSNQRTHWSTKARRTHVVRDMAHVMAKHQRVQLMPAATLEVVVKWGDRKRRDAENIHPTVKAAIDGVVSAGLLTDDSSRYLKHVGYSISDDTHRIPGVACFLELRFTEVAL